MAASLTPLIWLDPAGHFETWRLLLLLHALSAATQDVAIDALAINSVEPRNRGMLNGCMQAGMLTGRSVFGGGALLVSSWIGPEWMMAALVGWIAMVMPATLLLDESAHFTRQAERGQLRAGLAEMMKSRSLWLGLLFALLSAAAFEATGQLAGPFLIDRGVQTSTLGLFFGVIVVAAMLTGGLAGGRISDQWGRVRSVGAFLAAVVAAVVLLATADLAGARPAVLLTLLAVMYFCVGLFIAASYALFMDLTNPRLAGTQFSTFMAATNGCESWSALAGGRIAGSAGYPAAFLVMSVASLLSLPLLQALRTSLRAPHPEQTARRLN